MRVALAQTEADDALSAAATKVMRASMVQTEANDALVANFTKTGGGPQILGFDGDQPSGVDTSNYSFANMPAVAIPGDRMVILYTRGSDVPPSTEPPGSTLVGYLERLSAAQESNYTVGIFEITLASGDITAGKPNMVISTLAGNQVIAALLLRGVNSIQYSLSPMSAGATATSGFNRSASGAANSINSVSMTPSGGAGQIAVSALVRGGGLRTVTEPSGWTLEGEAEGPLAGASKRSVSLASKAAPVGVATGTAGWSVAGAADLTMTSFTMLLKP